MENRELKEYLAEFADNAPMSIIIANPKKRKVYIPEECFMIKDENIGKPVLCIQIAEERDMDEEERSFWLRSREQIRQQHCIIPRQVSGSMDRENRIRLWRGCHFRKGIKDNGR